MKNKRLKEKDTKARREERKEMKKSVWGPANPALGRGKRGVKIPESQHPNPLKEIYLILTVVWFAPFSLSRSFLLFFLSASLDYCHRIQLQERAFFVFEKARELPLFLSFSLILSFLLFSWPVTTYFFLTRFFPPSS